MLVLQIEVFLCERHLRGRQGCLLIRGDLVRFVQDRSVCVGADLQTGAVLTLVHERVHVADDRPFDVALGVGEERNGTDVLHLVNRGSERNSRAGHGCDARTPAPAGDHHIFGFNRAAIGHNCGNAPVGHFDVENFGVRQTAQCPQLLGTLTHDGAGPK